MLRDGSVVSQQLEQKQRLCHSVVLFLPFFFWLSLILGRCVLMWVIKKENNLMGCFSVSTDTVVETSVTKIAYLQIFFSNIPYFLLLVNFSTGSSTSPCFTQPLL